MSEALGWFPFHYQRFLASRKVRRMTAEQIGIYLLLICEQWDKGFVPDDDDELVSIGGVPADRVRAVLAIAFDRIEAGWHNLRLAEIKLEQEAKTRKRSAAGAAGAKAKWQAHSNRRQPQALDKIRVDKKKTLKARARGMPLPEDWKPNEKHQEIAKAEGLDVNAEAAKMRDWAESDGVTKKNWDATFNGWLRRAKSFAGSGKGKPWEDAKAAGELQAQRAFAAKHAGMVPVITERKPAKPPTPFPTNTIDWSAALPPESAVRQ